MRNISHFSSMIFVFGLCGGCGPKNDSSLDEVKIISVKQGKLQTYQLEISADFKGFQILDLFEKDLTKIEDDREYEYKRIPVLLSDQLLRFSPDTKIKSVKVEFDENFRKQMPEKWSAIDIILKKNEMKETTLAVAAIGTETGFLKGYNFGKPIKNEIMTKDLTYKTLYSTTPFSDGFFQPDQDFVEREGWVSSSKDAPVTNFTFKATIVLASDATQKTPILP